MQLHTVFTSVAIARLAYAAPSWHGFALARDLARVEGFMRRSMRWACERLPPPRSKTTARITILDYLRVLGPPPTTHCTTYSMLNLLAATAYNYAVPRVASKLIESNFSIRMLRDYI